jgi:hypothetical protein
VYSKIMSNYVRRLISSLVILFLILPVVIVASCSSAAKREPSVFDGTIEQRILVLVHGAASDPSELSSIKDPLDRWGYSVEVFDHTESCRLLNAGDRWYLEDEGGGRGDLDLVTDGNMNYRVIIFDPGDGTAYSDIDTDEGIVKQMFQEYPFLGIARMESSRTSNGDANNVFQIGTSGGAAKNLTINNPTGTWALEPFKGYHINRTSHGALGITETTSDVTALERFDDGTPAITLAGYESGARAIYFSFKDWGYAAHVSMLVRLIQEYSGMPYRKSYYAMEIDDCGALETANQDYIALIDWAKSNLGGYPTFAFMEYLMDPEPPPGIMFYLGNASQNTYFNPNAADLMAELRLYTDYVVASHGYQHDADWWKWTATGIPVDPYADQDGDGTPNWQDSDIDGNGIDNSSDPNLSYYSGGAFVEPNLEVQEQWFKRMREVLDLYGYSDTHVLIATKFEYLDGYTNGLAAKYGFTVISAKPSTTGYRMTLGWVSGTYVPGRVAPSEFYSASDNALDPAQVALFRTQFMGYIGGSPLSLVTNHLRSFDQGNTPGYELRDSYLSGYGVMKTAGFNLVSTQTAANKNIGWLWTDMSSTQDSAGNTGLTLLSSAFLDGKARHELDIVLPSSIKEVRVGDNYWIYVNDNNLFYGKQSNSSETLQISSGIYDSALPRISSVSTPATDVLNAVYDPTSGRVSLMLDGTFSTSVNLSNFRKPFSQGVTSIDSSGNSALTVNLAGVTSTESVDMSVAPSSGSVDVAVQTWETSGTRYKKWTESSAATDTSTLHTVGDLSPSQYYGVWYTKDGGTRTQLQTLQADGSGQISFTYDKGYSTVVFEVEAEAG